MLLNLLSPRHDTLNRIGTSLSGLSGLTDGAFAFEHMLLAGN